MCGACDALRGIGIAGFVYDLLLTVFGIDSFKRAQE